MASDALLALVNSSPLAVVTVVLICLNGGILMYLMARKLVSMLSWLVGTCYKTSGTERQKYNKIKKKERDGGLAVQSLASDQASKAPGKSIKKLLKENKKLSGMHTHEKIPDSDLFVMSMKGHSAAVLSIDVSSDGTRVVTTCEDHVLRVYYMNKLDYSNLKPPLTRIPLKQMPISAAFWGVPDKLGICFAPRSPGSTPLMATLTKTKEAKVVTGDGTVVATVQPNGIENYQIALSPDGRFLAVTTFSTDVKIWELQWAKDGTFLRCIKVMDLGHSKGVASVAFNADGTRAATSCKDGSFRIWNVNVRYHQQEDAKLLNRVEAKRVYSHMVWCPNDLIACAHGHELHWMKGVDKLCEIVDAHDGEITSLACTPKKVYVDGSQCFAVATAGRDGKARIWKCPDML